MMSSSVPISDILPRTQTIASASQTVFSTNWTANYSTDVDVYYTPNGTPPDDETQLLNSSQYSVAFIGGSQTVQVTLVTPANSGDIVTIVRNTPADRQNLYTNTNFTPSMLNTDFGILTLVDQQAQLVNQAIAPRYNYSAEINNDLSYPTRDTILPLLGANQTWVMNPNQTGIITYDLPQNGIAPADATYVTVTDETADLPNSVNFNGQAAGVTIFTGTGFITRSVAGTSNQITVTNATGVGGNITLSIPNNPVLPGTAGMGIPIGTTAQRVTPTPPSIGLRFNTDLELVEYYDASLSAWVSISNDTALLALLASHTPGEGASLIGLQGTGTVQDLADAPIVLQTSNAAVPNGLVLTAGSNITLTPGVGTLTIDASPGGGVNPGLINELAYYAAAGNTLSGLTTANSSVLVTSAGGVPSLSTVLPGGLTTTDPVLMQGIATKNYVDQTALNGTSVYAASAASLGTVTQSGSGVGATLTNAGAQATFALDGVNPPVGSNVLIKNTATGMTAANEGIYTVTDVGSGSTNWVLTRATDYDTPTEINNTGLILVQNGSTLSGTAWYNSATIVTVDTTSFNYTQFGNITFPISLAHGGTNANLTASNGGIFYSTATAGAILSGTVTANQVLLSGSSAAPAWSTATYPATTTINQLLYSNANNTIVGLATINSAGLLTNGSGVPGWVAYTGTGAPMLNTSPKIITSFLDTNGNTILGINPTASAVNYVQVNNAATTNSPGLQAVGTATNLDLLLSGKGTGGGVLSGRTSGSGVANGYVGEVVSATYGITTVSLTSATPTNIGSISLGAGDWDVWGSVYISVGAATTITSFTGGISQTSATLPSITSPIIGESRTVNQATFGAGVGASATIQPCVIQTSGSLTVYLVTSVNWSGGTGVTAGGVIIARRRA